MNKPAATSKPKPDAPVWLFIPYTSLDAFVSVNADLNNDATVQKAGADYLNAKKSEPAFERIDSWLLLAFQGMPRMQLPAFSKKKAPNRVFEMRDYESHSELKALSKIAMFNDGEIESARAAPDTLPRSATATKNWSWRRVKDTGAILAQLPGRRHLALHKCRFPR